MAYPTKVDLSKLKTPHYQGSVQNLYYLEEDDNVMVSETTASGSVFDVGSIFAIPGSDLCRAAFRHAVYTQLHTPKAWQTLETMIQEVYRDKRSFLNFLGMRTDGDQQGEQTDLLGRFQTNGALTHHIGMIHQATGTLFTEGFPPEISPFVLVEKFAITKPARVSYRDHHIWDYTPYRENRRHVIPLENIVRFGITSGSSIYRNFLHMEERQRRAFLKRMGVSELPLWRFFPVPLADFTSKYEPEDRNLTCQEALHISGCPGAQFLEIIQMSLLGSLLVKQFLQRLDLTLWDLKWEIAKKEQQLVFVDTIDTDSIRITCTVHDNNGAGDMFVHFNKQAMRDYYKIRHADWVEAIDAAKAAAATHGVPFQEILEEGQKTGRYPPTPQVHDTFMAIQEKKFNVLLAHILDTSQSTESTATSLSRRDDIQSIAQEEVAFYKDAGAIHSFLAINGSQR